MIGHAERGGGVAASRQAVAGPTLALDRADAVSQVLTDPGGPAKV